jgi:hypothetical protein
MLSAGGIAAFPLLVSFLHGLGLPISGATPIPLSAARAATRRTGPASIDACREKHQNFLLPSQFETLGRSADKKERLACYYNRRVVFPLSQPLAQLRYMSEIWNLRAANLSFGKY